MEIHIYLHGQLLPTHLSLKMKDKLTISFTRALEDYFTHTGCPTKLTSDKGAKFCSHMVDTVTIILSIQNFTPSSCSSTI